ncbi:MAG TPA: NADPH-dependent F420 reductase [Bryobacteraceae bacterium]|nr:NADPH-dependent F420 reductase [Bryobacteraceae bacterium]
MNQLGKETIALLGGTGKEGQGLALRFAASGFPVMIGSRDAAKAREKATVLLERLPGAAIGGGENTAILAQADLVFLCVPFDRASGLLDECRPLWKEGSAVVDTTVPLRFESGVVALQQLPENSGSEHLASHLPPGIPLVAAFKTISAHILAEVDTPLACDLVVCGDLPAARSRVIDVASTLSGLRVLDGGPLRHARALEAMCALAIGLNRRYKAHSARFRVVGV